MAALLAVFVLFHLGNHLTGLLGSAAHARVMEAGRTVYRSRWAEPVFIGFLLFPVAWLAWIAGVVFSIIAFLKAKDGTSYRYPFAVRLVK